MLIYLCTGNLEGPTGRENELWKLLTRLLMDDNARVNELVFFYLFIFLLVFSFDTLRELRSRCRRKKKKKEKTKGVCICNCRTAYKHLLSYGKPVDYTKSLTLPMRLYIIFLSKLSKVFEISLRKQGGVFFHLSKLKLHSINFRYM